MIRLVLSDLDGTLIDKTASMTKRDEQAILTLQKQNVAFGLVTGRDIGFCRHLLDLHAVTADCIIANNGGSLWIKEKKVMEHHMEAEETISLMEKLRPFLGQCHPFICSEDRVFFFMKNAYPSMDCWQAIRETLSYLGKLSENDLIEQLKETRMPVVKISLYTMDQKTTDALLPQLQQCLPEYEVLPTSYDYIEITRKGIHKGKTLTALMKQLDLKKEEVAVIGDGLNDVSMFPCVQHAFVMEHALQEVKQQGNAIVKNVAEALQTVIQYNRNDLKKES